MNPGPDTPSTPAASGSPAKAEPEKTHVAQDLAYERPLISCRFDPKGRFVFAGSEDRTVQRWDLSTGKRTGYPALESWPFGLAIHPDGETLFTGSCDGKLTWWPTSGEKPQPVRSVDAHRGWIRSVSVSPDGALVATGGNDRRVRIWSTCDGRLVQELPGHDKLVYRTLFDPSGRYLVSGDLQGVVIQWDHRPGKEARRFDAAKLYSYNGGQGVDYGGVRDMALSADGKHLACSGLIEASNPLGAVSNPAIVLLDWQEGKPSLLQRPKEDIKGVAWGVRFHPVGFLVAVSGGTSGGFLWFWKPDQPNEFFKFALPNTGRDLDLHPAGLRLAVAHHDGHLRICAMRAKTS